MDAFVKITKISTKHLHDDDKPTADESQDKSTPSKNLRTPKKLPVTDVTVKSSSRSIVKPSSDTPVKSSVRSSKKTPVKSSTKTPVKSSTKTPIKSVAKSSTKTPVKSPVKTSVKIFGKTSVKTNVIDIADSDSDIVVTQPKVPILSISDCGLKKPSTSSAKAMPDVIPVVIPVVMKEKRTDARGNAKVQYKQLGHLVEAPNAFHKPNPVLKVRLGVAHKHNI